MANIYVTVDGREVDLDEYVAMPLETPNHDLMGCDVINTGSALYVKSIKRLRDINKN